MSIPLLAVVARAHAHGVDEKYLRGFIDLVKTGLPIENADYEHIVLTLGRRLAEVRAQGKSQSMWITERVERVLQAYTECENLRVVTAAASNPWPVVL